MENQDLEQLNAEELWQRGSTALRAALADATWATWFQGVHPVEHHDDVLVLGVPNSVACERIRSSYAGLLTDTLRDATGHEIQVEFVVTTVHDDPDPELDLEVPASPPPLAEDVPTGGGMLKPRYRFKDFVIGSSNRFAHAAAMSVAEAPAQSYNPLFIYGPAGLGKTHLLHAIGHEVQTVFPAKRVRYVSTETFMNEFVNAIQTNTRAAFQRRYRDIDVLLIDDIQFLERSTQLQEEFFHTFNQLHQANGQIVMSSDRPPKSISELEHRLRSRFSMGLITDIQPPEFETRLAILRMRADAEHLSNVPDEVLAFIATNIHDNVRELEGALTRVAAYARLNGAALSEEIARQVLADLLPPDEPREITPELILDETAAMFGWTVEELCGKSRRRPLVTARQIGMYVFRELTDYSYPRIAEAFGGRDHTTVMYAVEKVKVQMAERHVIFEQVNELIGRIKLGTGG